MFDSFTQVDASTTRKYGGTGLGLAIVKQLCNLLGGDIDVTSELGKGSSFRFTLPVNVVSNQPLNRSCLSFEGEVLVVSPNSKLRGVIERQIKHWGAPIQSYETEQSGHKKLSPIKQNRRKFKLIIIDFHKESSSDHPLLIDLLRNTDVSYSKVLVMVNTAEVIDCQDHIKSLLHEAQIDSQWINSINYVLKPLVASDLINTLDQSLCLMPTTSVQTTSNQVEEHSEKNSTNVFLETSKILVVEDNIINTTVIEGYLEDLELEFVTAENGVEAIDCLKSCSVDKPFTCILMDCQMPEMDGYEATKAIRQGDAGEQYKTIPIIALTANTMQGDREKCLDAGMSDHLAKPLSFDALEIKILEFLKPIQK